jgi:hypothetical protein
VRRPLDGQALGQVVDAGPRRAGVRHAGEAAVDLGDDVDDRAALLRNHRPSRHRLRHREGADEVIANDLLEVLERHVGGGEGALPAGVVDQDVDARKALMDGVGKRRDLRRLADVAGHGQTGAGVSQRRDLGLDLLERLAPSTADGDRGAAARQLQRDGAADAGATARDDRHFAI